MISDVIDSFSIIPVVARESQKRLKAPTEEEEKRLIIRIERDTQ